MIALLAQAAGWLLALYGFYAIAVYVTAAFRGWMDAKRAREQEARCARMERQAERVRNEWWANEQLRRARSVANSTMLARLTPEDRAEIRRIIHESQTEAA